MICSEIGLASALVVPWLIGRAEFHDRNDMNQPGVIATCLDDRRDDFLLANMCFGDVLNLCSGRLRQFLGVRPESVTQGFSKLRIVKNTNVLRVQKARHLRRMARSWQRARNNNPVVTRQYARYSVSLTLNKRCIRRSLHLVSQGGATLTCLVPAWPA